MSPIANVATYLIENTKELAKKIVQDIIKQSNMEYSEEEISDGIAVFEDAILFFGKSLADDEAKVTQELVVWSRKIGERDAAAGKKITDSLELYPIIRTRLIKGISTISISYNLSLNEVLEIISRVDYMLDLSIYETIRTFDYFKDRVIKLAREELNELTAPVVPILEEVAVLPIIGAVDSHRAKYILEKVIPKVVEMKVQHLIIDFSGIHSLDTMVTRHVFKIHQVLLLLGIESSMTGIRPELAQSAVQIGIDLSSIKSYATVEQALKAIKHL